MKIAETKIYLKFIAWFLAIAVLPFLLLFALLFQFDWDKAIILFSRAGATDILFGFLVTLALILILAMIAAKVLSRSINNPVQFSVTNLIKVVEGLKRSIQDLSIISQNNREIVQSLSINTQKQQQNLASGQKNALKIAQSISQIAEKIHLAADNTKKIDSLTDQSEEKTKSGLQSLTAIRLLSTENQKLNQALHDYASKVSTIAERVKSMASLAKYLSINAVIEANKSNIGEEFNGLVSQVRELNSISQEAVVNIGELAANMQQQISQTKRAGWHESQEADKSIEVLNQTVKFMANITGQTKQISKNIKVINKQTTETDFSATQISEVLSDLNKQSLEIVKSSKNINQLIAKQSSICQLLSRSFNTLQRVVDNLDKMVGKTN